MSNGPTATVFGGTGFLGHAVVQALVARGYTVRVPARSLENAKDLKLMGQTGQVVPFRSSVRSDSSVFSALKGSSLVVNLIGQAVQTRTSTFQSLHVELAARIARLAKTAGVHRLIHVSSAGADPDSPLPYFRTKALGEAAVCAFFPSAVLFRPNLLFGRRDGNLNLLSTLLRYLPVLPRFIEQDIVFRPLFVGDLAHAIALAAQAPEVRGVFSAAGPEGFSLNELIDKCTENGAEPRMPFRMSLNMLRLLALICEPWPSPLFTREGVDLLVPAWGSADREIKGLEAFGLSSDAGLKRL